MLALGRHHDAASALDRAARRRGSSPVMIALMKSEALFGLGRYDEAEVALNCALRERDMESDLRARLRIERALALWHQGRVAIARQELRRAADLPHEEITEGRLQECASLMAWKDQDLAGARAGARRARCIYERLAHVPGLLRVLEKEGWILRDAGEVAQALEVQTQRVAVASRLTRLDLIACARTERGAVLVALGRWQEAREEYALATQLFKQLGDPRELTL
ncbi:MAG: tetratricopeptide repeat protein, partial [Vicinamibacteria bacterium]|nr:tetratricopeptide repeat protein [Vicinamibacteria bacterium]